ncbi:MAG TPA: nitroreductase family protein, partial [Polyangiaceae bacterium]|nr:nitroreductase family protein [Polyangiaceae bacterium]
MTAPPRRDAVRRRLEAVYALASGGYARAMGRIIDALNALQAERGHLDDASLRALGEELKVPLYRLQELVSFYPHFRKDPPKRVHLSICRDVACRMAASATHREALRERIAKHDDVELVEVSCLGRCDMAPAGAIGDCPVSVADLDALGESIATPPDVESAQRPPRSFACDPYTSSESRYGVTKSLVDAGLDPDAIVATLKESGLRGMGGAGFPTGVKWGMVRGQPEPRKYVVCNADESEPGTFKDRVALADLPHLVIEGMILAGLVVGAEEGIVFIRHEYMPEKLRLEEALADARGRGALGDDVLGSGRRFDIRVAVSPGGYILGEETALLECLEDKRGEPRNKPPYPGQHGLWGKPTLINNVETFAMVPKILKDGAEAWKSLGKGDSPGLKLVALSGDVNEPDVYEVPMGTTLRELIELGGGVVDGKALLAIAPGGASSNFVAADQIDLPLDFDALAKAGTMLGSGAVLVVAEGRDLVDLSSNLVAFFRNESCGKCVPCRVGSEKAVVILEEALAGRGDERHLEVLTELRDT